MEPIRYSVEAAMQGNRLDTVLATRLEGHSRTLCQELILSACVSVNGNFSIKPSYQVKEGDLIEVVVPQPEPATRSSVSTGHLAVTLLYEHDEFLIIYKPSGLVVHAPHSNSSEVTLVDWLTEHYPELSGVGVAGRSGIVHRLDKDTSGLMIIPRTPTAHSQIGLLFEKREIEKVYQAVVEGHPSQQGICEESIGRHPVHRHKMAPRGHGRTAFTAYTVATYYDTCSLIYAFPKTGRTHQIRVHCAFLGHPIIGDSVYGSRSKKINRQALHAYQLSFTYKERWYSFIWSMPIDMQLLIKQS